jgi:hypothetical protein
MALSLSPVEKDRRPRWPERRFDPARADFHYGAFADELRLWFDPEPVGWFSDPIDTPEGSDTAVMVGVDANGRSTNEIVGIHVFLLLDGPARHRPEWRRLAEPDPPADLVAAFVAEVRALFERHWRPAPPIAEQFSALRRDHPVE